MNRLASAALLAVTASHAAADPVPCNARPELVGTCHVVHGELQLFDGTPSARIHAGRGSRVFGVADVIDGGNETFDAPQAVRDAASFDGKLRGDFEVCPLERSRPGRMQLVCVAGASKLETWPPK